jgi:anaphase-promoting complex subunit 4
VSDFTALLESLRKMRLLAHTVQQYANDEKRQFASFSKWLRFCIDFEATEPESASRTEMEARDPGVDIAMVLEYIQYGLTKSDLTPYLLPEAQLSQEQRGSEAASYEDTRRAIELLKEGAQFMPQSLCLEHVLGHLSEGTTRLLRQVSQWQENNIQMDNGIVLEDEAGDEGVTDMRMVFDVWSPFIPPNTNPKANTSQPRAPSPAQETDISTFILLTTPSTPHLHIHRLTHAPTLASLPRDLRAHAIATLDFTPAHATLIDAKFADDETLLVLLHVAPKGEEVRDVLIALPYSDASADDGRVVNYSTADTDASARLLPFGTAAPSSARRRVRIDTAAVETHTRHVFEARFTPLRLVVNGRRGRRVVVVLGSDKRHYRVLDLDYGEGAGEGEEGEDDGDVEMGGA